MKRRGDAREADESDECGARADRGEADGQDDTSAQLGAMRAVWLSMREEDPPDGGLVDLLAAARAKAATMGARPTLWQRVLAVARRPPALAFATVVVLLGGAVLFIGRGGKMRAEIAAGTSGAVVPHMQPVDGKTAIAQPPSAPRAPSVPAPGEDRSAPPVKIERAHRASPLRSTDAARVPGPAVAAEHHGAAGAAADGEEGLRVPEEPAVGADERAEAAKTEAPPTQALLEQLYRQCESAARRGDCAVVRQLVGRIARADGDVRARLVKEAAVAKCLADAAE